MADGSDSTKARPNTPERLKNIGPTKLNIQSGLVASRIAAINTPETYPLPRSARQNSSHHIGTPLPHLHLTPTHAPLPSVDVLSPYPAESGIVRADGYAGGQSVPPLINDGPQPDLHLSNTIAEDLGVLIEESTQRDIPVCASPRSTRSAEDMYNDNRPSALRWASKTTEKQPSSTLPKVSFNKISESLHRARKKSVGALVKKFQTGSNDSVRRIMEDFSAARRPNIVRMCHECAWINGTNRVCSNCGHSLCAECPLRNWGSLPYILEEQAISIEEHQDDSMSSTQELLEGLENQSIWSQGKTFPLEGSVNSEISVETPNEIITTEPLIQKQEEFPQSADVGSYVAMRHSHALGKSAERCFGKSVDAQPGLLEKPGSPHSSWNDIVRAEANNISLHGGDHKSNLCIYCGAPISRFRSQGDLDKPREDDQTSSPAFWQGLCNACLKPDEGPLTSSGSQERSLSTPERSHRSPHESSVASSDDSSINLNDEPRSPITPARRTRNDLQNREQYLSNPNWIDDNPSLQSSTPISIPEILWARGLDKRGHDQSRSSELPNGLTNWLKGWWKGSNTIEIKGKKSAYGQGRTRRQLLLGQCYRRSFGSSLRDEKGTNYDRRKNHGSISISPSTEENSLTTSSGYNFDRSDPIQISATLDDYPRTRPKTPWSVSRVWMAPQKSDVESETPSPLQKVAGSRGSGGMSRPVDLDSYRGPQDTEKTRPSTHDPSRAQRDTHSADHPGPGQSRADPSIEGLTIAVALSGGQKFTVRVKLRPKYARKPRQAA